MSWKLGPAAGQCTLFTATVVTGAAGTYSVAVQATDNSAPVKTVQDTYTIVVRNEYSINATLLMDAVQGRPYGTGTGCLPLNTCTQVSTTTLAATEPAIVGSPTALGNGPIVSCAVPTATPSNPGVTATAAPAQSECTITSTGTPSMVTGAAGPYSITISVTDTPITVTGQALPVVPANTITKTFPLMVHGPIQIAQTLTATWPDAVSGRAYGSGAGCTGGNCAPAVYTASNGLANETIPAGAGSYVWTALGAAGNNLQTLGFNTCAVTKVTNPNDTDTCSATKITAAPTTSGAASITYSPNITVTDTANQATPAATTTTDPLSTRTDKLIVDSPLSFSLAQAGNPTPTNPTNLLDAVTGRTYGVINAPTGTPTYTPVGGLGAINAGSLGNSLYRWCISAGTLPATFSNAGNNLNSVCTAQVESPSETLEATSDITQAVTTATAFPFTVQLNDTGNGSTPVATLTNSTTLTLQPPLMATLTQNGATVASGSALLPGVNNRSYGVISSGAGAPTFTAAGGLGQSVVGNGAYGWCISLGALPAGFIDQFAAHGTGMNILCTAGEDVENTATLLANTVTQAGSANPITFTVRLDDGGNPAVPTGVISGTTNVVNTSIIVYPQISLAVAIGTTQFASGVTGTWPDAVSGRAYGTGGGCTGAGGCAPAVYTPAGGLGGVTGSLGGYVWPGTVNNYSNITGLTCSVVNATTPTTYSCSTATTIGANPTGAGAASISYSPSTTVTDTPNAATPAATVATDPNSTRTDTLWVDAPLLATLIQTGDTPTSTNPAALIPGVSGRSYASGALAAAAPTYTATGGLGARAVADYEWCVDTAASLPAGLTGITVEAASGPCTTFGPTGVATASLSSSDITAAITPPSQNFPFTVELDDPGNGSTPSSVFSGQAATNSTSLLINAPLAVNLTQTGNPAGIPAGTNPPNLLPGVTNRPYGVGNGTPTYTASGGLGLVTGYTFLPASPGPFPGGFACSSNTTSPYTCSAATVTAAANTYSGLTVTVNDAANPAVPNGNVTSTTSLLVNPQLTVTTNLGPAWPDAVDGRLYGQGNGCTPGGGACTAMIYTAAGGLGASGGYTFTNANFPTPIACTPASPTLTCSAASAITQAAGTTHPTVTAVDFANTATPAATTSTDPGSTRGNSDSLIVDAALGVTLTQTGNATPTNPGTLLPGVVNRTYGIINAGGGAPTYAATGGLGAVGSTLGAAAYEWCVDTGPTTLPSGLGGISTACGTPTTGAASESLSGTISNSATVETYSFTVALDDPGNLSTPASSVGGGTAATNSTSLPINAALAVTLSPLVGGAFPPAVLNRSYGTGIGTCLGGANCAPITYTVTAGTGLPNSSNGYSFSAITNSTTNLAGDFPTGFTCPAVGAGATVYTCTASPVATSVTPATFTPSVTVTDTANEATPQGSVPSTTNLVVNPEITLTTNNGPNWPDAVDGRTYGSAASGCTGGGGVCAAMKYTAAGGLGAVGGYTFPTQANFPSPISCSTSSPTLTCSATSAITASSGTTNPMVTAVDVANASTPAATIGTDAGSTQTDKLIVDPILGVTLTQTGNSTPTNPGTLLPGVVNRTYGLINAGAGAPSYAGTGGLGAIGSTLGAGAYEWCVNVGSLPSGLGGISTNCAAPTTGAASESLSGTISNSATVETYSFTVALDDPGNLSTPASSVGGGTAATSSTNLPINAALAVTPSPLVGGAFPPAVLNRSYGTGIGTCLGGANCAPITYTVTAGSGLPNSSNGYSFSAITNSTTNLAGDFPTGFTCPAVGAGATVYTCTASPVATSVTPATFTPSVTVTDTANEATPQGSVPSTTNLVVNPEITLTTNNGPNWPDAVVGRTYGSAASGCTGGGGACAAMKYTAAGGLGAVGGYTFPTQANFPSPISCSTSSPTLTCSATSAITASSGTTNPMVAAVDVANASTPAATTGTDAGSTQTDNLMVDAALGVTLSQTTNGTPNTALLPGVVGRTYGWVGGTPTYTAAGGLGAGTAGVAAYEWCVSGGPLPTGLSGISTNCSPFGTTGSATESLTTGSSTNITDSTITSTCSNGTCSTATDTFPFTVELADTGNLSTPLGSQTNATSLLINAPLMVPLTENGSTIANGGNLLPAVTERSYGTGNNCVSAGPSTTCTPPTYTASYGLGAVGGYTFPASPGPFAGVAGFSCSLATTNPYTCAASQVTAASSGTPYALSLTVNDAANAAVPAGNATWTANLLVNPQITLATNNGPNWPDAVNGRAYGTPAGGPAVTGCTGGNCAAMIYTASGGLGAVGGYTFPTSSGFPTPIACSTSTPTLTCATPTSTTITQAAGTTNPTVTAEDVANAAAPAATATPGCAYNVSTCSDPGSAQTDKLIVDPILGVTLAQFNNATPNTALLPGVVGRTYGSINCPGASCAAPTYTAAGGLGGTGSTLGVAAYEWCVNTGAGSLPGNLGGISTSCGTPTTGAGTESLTSGASNITDSNITCSNGTCTLDSQNFTPITVELDDTGNLSTPSSIPSASNTSATTSTSLLINAPLTAQMMQSGNPTALSTLTIGSGTSATLLPGVTNRSYGQVATTLAQAAPPIFSAVGGLLSAGGKYLWCVNSGSLPLNEAASASAFPEISTTCGSATSTQSYTVQLSTVGSNPVGAANTYTFSVQADDGGNSAVPSTFAAGAGDSIIGTLSLTINPQISLALAIGSTNYSAGVSGTWPDAVYGRPYGSPSSGSPVTGCTGGNCAAAVYTASDGLGAVGGYSWTALGSSGDNLQSFGFSTCAQSTVTDTNDTNTCNAATISAGNSGAGAASVTYGSGTGGPMMTLTDMANAATPAATATSCPGPTTAGATCTDPESTRTDQLTVDAPLLSTLTQSGNGTPGTALYLAVTGRDYGDGTNTCSGGGTTPCTPPSYAATGGLGANPTGNGGLGVGAYEWCIQSGTGIGLPPASLDAPGPTAFTAYCPTYPVAGVTPLVLSGQPITDAANAYPFTVELDDTGNTATPGSSSVSGASSTSPTSLTVEPVLAVSVVSPTGILTLPPAVVNRDYGNPTGTDNCGTFGLCSPLTYMASGGLLNSLSAYASLSPTGIATSTSAPVGAYFPDGFGCSNNSTNTLLTCTAQPVIAGDTTGTYTPSVIAIDTANPATPSGIGSPPSIFQSLPVNPQITLGQSLGTTWQDAVHGRAFGSPPASPVTGCTGGNCAAAVYSVTAGQGLAPYVWPSTPASLSGLGMSCTSSTNPTYTCNATSISAAPSAVGGTSITYTGSGANPGPSVTVTDTANPTTPAATATPGCTQNATTCTDPSSTRTDTITVDAPLLVTLTQTGNSLTDTQTGQSGAYSALDDGVAARNYGEGSNCGSGGSTACAYPNYAATGGLGAGMAGPTAYQWCIQASSALPPAGLDVGTTPPSNCATAKPAIYFASGTPLELTGNPINSSANTTTSPIGYPYTVELDDTGNGSTPSSAAFFSNTPSTAATSVNVWPALTATLAQTGNTNVPTSLLLGVVGRSYGIKGSPPTYTATGGLANSGAYLWCVPTGSSTLPPNLTGISTNCGLTTSTSATSVTLTATAGSPIGGSATTYDFSVQADDGGNGAVPNTFQAPSGAGLVPSSGTTQFPVSSALAATLTQGASTNPTVLLDGVADRTYGTIGDPPTYTAAGGMGSGNYYWCLTGTLPSGFSGAPSSTCGVGASQSTKEDSFALTASTAAGLANTYTGITAQLDDAGNAAVPDSVSSTTSSTTATKITIDPEIVVQNATQLPNGQINQPYSVLFTCQAPLGTGTCGGTGIPNNAAAVYTWTASSNNITGVGSSFPVAPPTPTPPLQATYAAIFSGTPTATGSGETVTISITDDGNAATPSCSAAGTCPTNTSFNANILPSLAYVGSNSTGNPYVDIFDTSTGTPSFVSTLDLTTESGVTPNYVAASSNGTYMYVADPGKHQVYIITPPSTVKTLANFPQGLYKTAGDTAAVAVGPQGLATVSPSNPDNLYVYVANASNIDGGVQVIDANSAHGGYGVVYTAISFNGGPYSPDASDLKVAPTFSVATSSANPYGRLTHGYVLRPGTPAPLLTGDEVCVFDAEPSDESAGTFLNAINAANGANGDGCISLVETTLTPRFIDVSPDGLYAFVTEGNSTDTGYLEVIDTNPNDTSTFETVIAEVNLSPAPTSAYETIYTGDGSTTAFTGGTFTPNPITPGDVLEVVAGSVTGFSNSSGTITGTGITAGSVNYTTGAVSVTFTVAPANTTPIQFRSVVISTNPAGVRVSPDGQTVWVAGEDYSGLLAFETAKVGTAQFGLAYHFVTPNYATVNEAPIGLAFRPDEAFGLATLSDVTTPAILPFTTTAGTEVDTTGLTAPWGIDHLPNPVLHITTTALPAAKHGAAYKSSIVAAGPNRYYTFSDVTSGTTLSSLGLTLNPADGEVSSSNVTGAAGPYTFSIQVTDQTLPVNNVVVQKTVSLTIAP